MYSIQYQYRTIDRYDRYVKLGLDQRVIILLPIQQRVISRVEYHPRKRHWLSENVTKRSVVFTARVARSELT